MIAITTNSSIRVKPLRLIVIAPFRREIASVPVTPMRTGNWAGA